MPKLLPEANRLLGQHQDQEAPARSVVSTFPQIWLTIRLGRAGEDEENPELVWMYTLGGLAERVGGGDTKEGNRSPSTSALYLPHTDTCSQWDHMWRHSSWISSCYVKPEQHPSAKGPPPRGTLVRREEVEEGPTAQWTNDTQQSSGSQPTQAYRTESQDYQRSPSQWSASRTSSPLVMCVCIEDRHVICDHWSCVFLCMEA